MGKNQRELFTKLDFNKLLETAYEYRKKDKYDEALAVINEAILLFPDSNILEFAYWERGNIYKCLEKYELALADINKAMCIAPELIRGILYDRIHIYEKMNEHSLAIIDYSFNIDYSYGEIHRVMYRQVETENVENQIKKLYRFIRNDLEYRGKLYQKMGCTRKAEKDFDRASKIWDTHISECKYYFS